MVKCPGRIVVRRSTRNFGTADHRNFAAAPSQFAQALASHRPPVSSLPSEFRLGSPGEPALVGATLYEPQAVLLRGSTRSLTLKAGEPLEVTSNQGCNALHPNRVRAHPSIASKETTVSKQPVGEISDEIAEPALFET